MPGVRWAVNDFNGSEFACQGPIAGKPVPIGRSSAAFNVGDYPALWAALSRREQSPLVRRIACRSGFSREAGAAVDGTGFAGVRG